MKLGIAIITCDRFADLENLYASIKKYTHADYEVLVCNDSRNSSSQSIANKLKATVMGKENGGVIVNKNRALYYFSEIKKVDVLIFLEDDVLIKNYGWEEKWIEGALRYGQISAAPPWYYETGEASKHLVSGTGTLDDPYVHKWLTAQCVSVRMDLIPKFGYLDDTFKGYGYGHMEWTNRFLREGYGGYFKDVYMFYLIKDGDLEYLDRVSYKSNTDLASNWEVYRNKYYSNSYISCPEYIKKDKVYSGKKPVNVLSMWYNEEVIAPYFMAHYEDWVDRMYILLDTATTDGTKDLLEKNPKVTIIPYTFNDGFKENLKVEQFNNFYSKFKEDGYLICVDSDEFVFPFDFSSIPDADAFLIRLSHPFRNTLDSDLDPTKKPTIMQRRYGVIDNPYYNAGNNYTKPCVVKTGGSVSWAPGQHSVHGPKKIHPEILSGVHWQSADPSIVLYRHTKNRTNISVTVGQNGHFKLYTEAKVKEECERHLNAGLLF